MEQSIIGFAKHFKKKTAVTSRFEFRPSHLSFHWNTVFRRNSSVPSI